MNSHKNVKTTFVGRKLLIERIRVEGLMPAAEAAVAHSATHYRPWLGLPLTPVRTNLPGLMPLCIKHSFTHPCRPQTNGKAERFIQTCLREWAYTRTHPNSAEPTSWLPAFLAEYNCRGPHSALAYKPPASRLGGNNLL